MHLNLATIMFEVVGTSWKNMSSCVAILFTIYINIFEFSIIAPLLFHVRQL